MILSEEVRIYMDHVPTRDGDTHYIHENRLIKWANKIAELEAENRQLKEDNAELKALWMKALRANGDK